MVTGKLLGGHSYFFFLLIFFFYIMFILFHFSNFFSILNTPPYLSNSSLLPRNNAKTKDAAPAVV